MAKISAKNGVILINGYNFSTYGMSYDGSSDVGKIDVTGFGDGAQNFIPGLPQSELTVGLLWDSTATVGVHAVLKSLPNGIVTILPEGNNPAGLNASGSVSMPFTLGNYSPKGEVTGAIEAGVLQFSNYGASSVALEHGLVLAHNTITATTTGAESQDPSIAAVTAPCSGTLQVWTPTTTDTYVVKIQHATTSGGAFADLVTFTLNGTARGVERVNVASGVINRYRRVLATRTGAGAQPFGFTVHFWHGWYGI